jgi:hypothetical protein
VGKKGILLFEGIKGGGAAGAGHFDIWNGTETASVDEHWTDAGHISLWELAE